MDLSTAGEILRRVRVFYAGGHKSNNKLYNALTDEAVYPTDMKIQANTQKALAEFDPDEVLQKDVRRAQHANLSGINRTIVSAATANKSRYEKAKIIYASSDYASGNCGEMANVASYLAISVFGADRNELWIGRIAKPGDHVFCLVGPTPAAKTVQQMNNGSLVIDPWLNTSCTSSQYEHRAMAKFWKWHKQGKRIAFTGSVGYGWYAPGGEYLDTFLTAPLSFVRADP
jgi:hypothetical protein